MGIERNSAAFLLKLRDDGVRYGHMATLGRQTIYLLPSEYAAAMRRCGRETDGTVPYYADDLLDAIGAVALDTIDASAFESASLVHDLNVPVPDTWHGRYDVVFDGGTLEHVFNVPVALASIMQMVRVGGRLVFSTPANSWCGHGFYQFSPELFWRALSEENGFSIVDMYVSDGRRAYSVAEPRKVKARVELCTRLPMTLLVHARKDASRTPFVTPPQQSDYAALWTEGTAAPVPRTRWKTAPVIRDLLQLRRHMRFLRARSPRTSPFFTPVDLSL